MPRQGQAAIPAIIVTAPFRVPVVAAMGIQTFHHTSFLAVEVVRGERRIHPMVISPVVMVVPAVA
jgi:hypothetical protein